VVGAPDRAALPTTDAPVLTDPTTAAKPAAHAARPARTTVVLPIPAPPPGPSADEPLVELGSLSIPAIGVDVPLFEGVTLPTISHGPSHWPGTALPGQVGNVVVAGHRVTHTRPFRNLDELQPGDQAVFTTAEGTFTYELTGIEVVTPDRLDIVQQTMAYTATMFACHPPGSARERIVTHWQMLNPPPGAATVVRHGDSITVSVP
jgi:sortase A